MDTFTPSQVYVEGLTDWAVITGSVPSLRTHARTGSFLRGVEFITRISAHAEAANHHPDLRLTYTEVAIALTTHDAGGLTEADVKLARQISTLAEDQDVVLDPRASQSVEVAIDAFNMEAILPFWAAVLGYEPGANPDELRDPGGELPGVWFQQMDFMRPERNRIHIDVHVSLDEAPDRVEAVLAAGGKLMDDSAAPSFWVLADAEGNEACVCTWREK